MSRVRHVSPDGQEQHDGRLKYCAKSACEEMRKAYDADNSIVRCDGYCGAKEVPVSEGEFVRAHDHWKYHSVLSGCAHGS